MMQPFPNEPLQDLWLAHLRANLLQFLAQLQGYKANSVLLADAVKSLAGFDATHSQVRGELAWLAEQGLITTSEVIDGLVVATLIERGGDVAAGRAVVLGVQRPNP